MASVLELRHNSPKITRFLRTEFAQYIYHLVPGQKESVIDAVERMVDLCETDFKNSATWKSLEVSVDSSFSTESEKASGQNNGWSKPNNGEKCV